MICTESYRKVSETFYRDIAPLNFSDLKRQNLKRKVEEGPPPPTKEGEEGCLGPLASPNDSGPYATIDDDVTDFRRTPVGRLPSYISLASSEPAEDKTSKIDDMTLNKSGSDAKYVVLEANGDCKEHLI